MPTRCVACGPSRASATFFTPTIRVSSVFRAACAVDRWSLGVDTRQRARARQLAGRRDLHLPELREFGVIGDLRQEDVVADAGLRIDERAANDQASIVD
jgi:hypothetical protein